MKELIKLLKLFNTTKTGRTIQRALKTFLYAAVASYIANRISPFMVDWTLVIETGLLAAIGFGSDKGIREYNAK